MQLYSIEVRMEEKEKGRHYEKRTKQEDYLLPCLIWKENIIFNPLVDSFMQCNSKDILLDWKNWKSSPQ